MKERPILFNGEMVRAILDGRKTQTRRVMLKSDGSDVVKMLNSDGAPTGEFGYCPPNASRVITNLFRCPFGQIGDRLWVRETWKPTGLFASSSNMETEGCGHFAYATDGEQRERDKHIKWRPSIFMPRWASRITLEITDVRVERLNSISEGDAYAEGIEEWLNNEKNMPKYADGEPAKFDNVQEAFLALWKSIYGGASLDANPWVWVVEFKRVSP